MNINDKFYTSINDFDMINDFQFIAVTNYGVVLFDTTMNFNGYTFTNTQDAVDYIISILN